MITDNEKSTIAINLQKYVDRYDSQNKAANTLKGISSATISHVLNNKWEQISDEMWRSISAQISTDYHWQPVETRFYKFFTKLLNDSKEHSLVFAVAGEAGSGKSFTARHFSTTNRNTYHIICKEWWKNQLFLSEILRVMGCGSKVNNNDNSAMFNSIVTILQGQDRPLIIFDEADKLQDTVIYSLISLYNELEFSCGMVLCATHNLEQRLVKGAKQNKRGYNEIYSRVGRKVVTIPRNTDKDIRAICQVNGIEDNIDIQEIINEAEFDLRRVRRKIHAIKVDGTSN